MFDVKYTNVPKGVSKLKKESIIANLCSLMPNESRQFWKDLEESHINSDDDDIDY